jgi:hypothetical protein
MKNKDIGCLLTGVISLVMVAISFKWLVGMITALGISVLASLGVVAVHPFLGFSAGGFLVIISISILLRIFLVSILFLFGLIGGLLASVFD